jgi:hypothetical protein|tara:strand:- start:35 stop:145 length:111 start_codon:yes stop_codon:yes gene_type:complete
MDDGLNALWIKFLFSNAPFAGTLKERELRTELLTEF